MDLLWSRWNIVECGTMGAGALFFSERITHNVRDNVAFVGRSSVKAVDMRFLTRNVRYKVTSNGT